MKCCSSCYHEVEGGFCPLCESPVPSIDTMSCLPLALILGNEFEIKDLLLAEYYHTTDDDDDSNQQDGKESHMALYETSEEAKAAVNRSNRKLSRVLHPDRNPDTHEEWVHLNKARNILRDDKLRRSYVRNMVGFICGYSELNVDAIYRNHDEWMKRNDPSSKEETQQQVRLQGLTGRKGGIKEEARKFGPQQQTRMKTLEHGLTVTALKKPIVSISRGAKHKVVVYLNQTKFRDYCQEVTLYGTCGTMDYEIKLAEAKRDDAAMLYDNIQFDVDLPCFGMWEFAWDAKISFLEDGRDAKSTPRSASAVVDVGESEQRLSIEREQAALVSMAAHRATLLQSATKRLSKSWKRQKIEEHYDRLHEFMVKATNARAKLQLALQEDESKPVADALSMLIEAILLAQDTQKQFQTKIAAYPKRDKKRAFRRAVAEQLEAGNPESWMKSVCGKDLENMGGDTNRLWQLLAEGKGHSASLSYTHAVLAMAEERDDLFTAKQRKSLSERAAALSRDEAREMEQILQERPCQKETTRTTSEGSIKKLNDNGHSPTPPDFTSAFDETSSKVEENSTKRRPVVSPAEQKQSRSLISSSVQAIKGVLDWTIGKSPLKGTSSSRARVATAGDDGEESQASDGSNSPIPDLAATNSSSSQLDNASLPKDEKKEEDIALPTIQKAPMSVSPHDGNLHLETRKGGGVGQDASSINAIEKPKLAETLHMISPCVSVSSDSSFPPAISAPSHSPKSAFEKTQLSMRKCDVIRHKESTLSSFPNAVPAVVRKVMIDSSRMEYVDLPGIMSATGANIELSHFKDGGAAVFTVSGAFESTVAGARKLILDAEGDGAAIPRLNNGLNDLSIPANTVEEASSVSALTADLGIGDVIGGEEIAFQLPLKRATSFIPIIGKVSPLSELATSADPLFFFLGHESACFKVSPESFYQWLLSQDIGTLKDLAEAMADDDFVTEDMRENGFKLFKRKTFTKAIALRLE